MDGRPTNSERSVCLWAPAVAVVGGGATRVRRNPFHHLVSCDDVDDVDAHTEGPTEDADGRQEGRIKE